MKISRLYTKPRFYSVAQNNLEMACRAFSFDVTAAILVFHNKEKETVAVLVYQTNPSGIELYFYANILLCFS